MPDSYGFKKDAKYCVANMGGCGGTLMTSYLIDQYGEEAVFGVHKRDFVEFSGTTIFLFGNPYNAVMSMHRRVADYNLELHYDHFGKTPPKDPDAWIYEDTLGLEDLFDDWYRKHTFKTVALRYETLWDNLQILQSHTGIDFSRFPKRIRRKSIWQKQRYKSSLEKTYKRLASKISSAKDIKI